MKYLIKIVTILYLILVKVLSGPLFGLAISVLYCSESSPYLQGQQCYSPMHIVGCILAALLIILVGFALLTYALLFYSRNPFEDSSLGQPNRNYALSKSLLKLLFPTFFVINATLKI